MRRWHRTLPLAAACGLALHAPTSPAALAWARLDDTELQALRGGFISTGGLHIDFSMEQMVLVNGEPQAYSSLQLPNGLATPPSGFLQVTEAGSTSVQLAGGQGVIQNSLDGQELSHLRIINLEFGNLQGLGRLDLQRRLEQSLIDTLR